jgi:hypothetical protein
VTRSAIDTAVSYSALDELVSFLYVIELLHYIVNYIFDYFEGPLLCGKKTSRHRGRDIESGEEVKSVATTSALALHQGVLERRVSRPSSEDVQENFIEDTPSRDSEEHNSAQPSLISFPRVRRISGFIETLFYFYRCILPISVWMRYFSSGPLAETCIVLYLCFKATKLSQLTRAVLEIFQCFFLGHQVENVNIVHLIALN